MEKNLRYNSEEGYPILGAINKIDRLYEVPLHYFEELPAAIMAKIRLNGVSREMGFSVPEGYFAGLASQIMTRIHAEDQLGLEHSSEIEAKTTDNQTVEEELAEVAPFLLGISRKDVYSVPQHYFASLAPLDVVQPSASQELGEQQVGAKVVPMDSKRSIWRTAVAAAAVVLVLFSGQRFLSHQKGHNRGDVPVSTGNQFAAKIYTNTDSQATTDNTLGLEELSDEEILNYLNTVDPSSVHDSVDKVVTEETQKAISDMSSEELESYLERTPAIY